MANSQIPLQYKLFDSSGIMSQPWAFFFQNFVANLPPGEDSYVVNGVETSLGVMTLYIGTDGNKGVANNNSIYFAYNTGKIYVANQEVWYNMIPAFNGDVTSSAGSTTLTLNEVNGSPGSWGSSTQIPVVVVDSKGRITNIYTEPVTVNVIAPGSNGNIIINNNGALGAATNLLYSGGILYASDIGITDEITFNDPTPTLNNLLPSQTQGLFLGSDGTDTEWLSPNKTEYPFTFGDATPANLYLIPAGKFIENISITILTAFTDSSATLEIGDADDPNRFMDTTDSEPAILGSYGVYAGYKYGSDTQLLLTITAGSSTAGNGIVVIEYQN